MHGDHQALRSTAGPWNPPRISLESNWTPSLLEGYSNAQLVDIRLRFICKTFCSVLCTSGRPKSCVCGTGDSRCSISPVHASISTCVLFKKSFCRVPCTAGRPKPCVSGTDGPGCSTPNFPRCAPRYSRAIYSRNPLCSALCTSGRPKTCVSGTDGSRCSISLDIRLQFIREIFLRCAVYWRSP
jgi:hypothetical protein